jgi:hypothetical protein
MGVSPRVACCFREGAPPELRCAAKVERSRLEQISLAVARVGSYSSNVTQPLKLQQSLDGPTVDAPRRH